MVVNLNNESEIPMYAEPWFLSFNADVQFKIAMTPEDLQNAGLDELVKKWVDLELILSLAHLGENGPMIRTITAYSSLSRRK